MKIVVVGGVAGGMSFAARARRLSEESEIIVLERDPYVSFANCGLPYFLGGEIKDRQDLLLHTPESLKESLNLDVRTGHEVISIDPKSREVLVRESDTGSEYQLSYDRLVLSTGARAFIPPIPGVDLPVVHTLRNIPDVDKIVTQIKTLRDNRQRIFIVGAGFIGLEAAEAFRHQGLEVSIVELADQVLAPLDPEMAQAVENELINNGVQVFTGMSVEKIESANSVDNEISVHLSDGSSHDGEAVILAIGVRPESTLAKEAGLEVNERGSIITDENLLTSNPFIYALGDAIEVVDAVTNQPASVPLAGPANRQGRVAADHVFGRKSSKSSVLGTAIVRVFGTVAATTGQNEKSLNKSKTPYFAIHLHPNDHAGYFPGANSMHMKLLFTPDGKILGGQITGISGVDKRIDVIATAIRAKMTIDDLAELELAYAPPFGSAKDPINMAGFIAQNILAGDVSTWNVQDLDYFGENAILLDVRSKSEFDEGHITGALRITHTEIRDQLDEIPKDVPIFVYCQSGFRSYLASRILKQSGWSDVRSLDGGLRTLQLYKRAQSRMSANLSEQ